MEGTSGDKYRPEDPRDKLQMGVEVTGEVPTRHRTPRVPVVASLPPVENCGPLSEGSRTKDCCLFCGQRSQIDKQKTQLPRSPGTVTITTRGNDTLLGELGKEEGDPYFTLINRGVKTVFPSHVPPPPETPNFPRHSISTVYKRTKNLNVVQDFSFRDDRGTEGLEERGREGREKNGSNETKDSSGLSSSQAGVPLGSRPQGLGTRYPCFSEVEKDNGTEKGLVFVLFVFPVSSRV